MKSKMKRKFTLRTGLLTALTVALIASAAVFIGASAAESVSPTDVVSASNTVPKHSVSHSVKQSGVSPSDVSASDVQASIIVTREAEPDVKNVPNLGAPAITMTTSKAVGESINFDIDGSDIYIDYGDGTPVEYTGDGIVKGSEIKVYGDTISSFCGGNAITSINASGCTSLTHLYCLDNRQLTSLDVSGCTALTELYCDCSGLTSLNISGCNHLERLGCGDNQLTTLTLPDSTALTYLNCMNNSLTVLDVSKNTALKELYCGDNQLTQIDVSANTELETLSCEFNPIVSFDESKYSFLKSLCCEGLNLTKLDLSNYHVLEELYCGYNQLTTLDVSTILTLKNLSCQNNRLTSLDVSNNTGLEGLVCDGNNLKSVDVTKNTSLTWFSCGNTQLSVLDVSNNKLLQHLYCDNNRLTTLDLSKNTELQYLNCKNNQLTSLDLSNNPSLGGDWELLISFNRFTFAEIYNSSLHERAYPYAPQTHVIPSTLKAGESIDLSSEYSVDGTISEFVWYDSDGNVVTPTQSANGVFTFGKEFVGKKLVCKMTNAKLPYFETEGHIEWAADEPREVIGDTRLTTTEVTIEEPDPVSEPETEPESEPETVSDSDIPVNNNSFVDSAEYSDDIKVTVNGVEIDIRKVQLIVSNIETNKKKTVLDAIKNYAKTFNVTEGNTALYDISLVDNNKVHVKVEKGKIKICLKYPDNLARQSEKYTFRLYHQKDDGTIEEIPVVCKPDGIYFEATSFSPFALVWNEKSSTGSPGTGESSVVIWNMFILLMLSAAAGAIVIYRNRFAEAE